MISDGSCFKCNKKAIFYEVNYKQGEYSLYCQDCESVTHCRSDNIISLFVKINECVFIVIDFLDSTLAYHIKLGNTSKSILLGFESLPEITYSQVEAKYQTIKLMI
jgi:hypothetical protein